MQVKLEHLAEYLARMEPPVEADPNPRAKAVPQPYQKAFVEDKSNVVIALGGNRSGKTEAAAIKSARRLLAAPPWYGAPFWVVGQSYDMAAEVCWTEKLSKYIPEALIQDIVWMDRKLGHPRTVFLRNGWRIEFKSMEQGREKFQARSLAACWIDEQFPAPIFLEIFARTSESRGQIFASLTPINPDPYLQSKYEEQAKGWSFHRFLTRDNKYLNTEWVEAFEREIPEPFKSVRLLGDFGGFEGAVYPMFSRSLCVIDKPSDDLISKQNTVLSLDFGFSNPFVCLWGYRDGDGVWTIYDEYYKSQTRMADHFSEITARNKLHKRAIVRVWADPEDAQSRSELSALGLSTLAASKTVRSGIEEVQRLMTPRSNGLPRLRIAAHCTNLIRELSTYRWAPRTEKREPDEPLKVNDHTCDALRYMLYSEGKWGVTRPAARSAPISNMMNSYKEVMRYG